MYWRDRRMPADGAWYGPLGSVVPFPNVKGTLDGTGGRTTLWTERADGAAQAMVLPRRPRTWSCSGEGLRPDEAAMVRYAADGLLGVGAHWWLTGEAVQLNALTPAICEGVGWSHGAVHSGHPTADEGEPGWAPRTVATVSASVVVLPPVPVLPDLKRVAVGMFARGADTQLSLRWLRADGTTLATTQVPSATHGTTGPGPLQRVKGAVQAHSDAVAVSLVATGGTLYANPSLAWSRAMRPYAPGEGCDRAWLYDYQWGVGQAGDAPSRSVSFQVREVA